MSYLSWNSETVTDFSPSNVSARYNQGYVFTRLSKGVMRQTRSLRIDLSKFELSSENRRVLRKIDGLWTTVCGLPLENYTWEIAKLAKDFYDSKFGKGVFSANKVKELLTDEKKSNFNLLLSYSPPRGYAICYENEGILHYAYPFYNLSAVNGQLSNVGMGMMLRAILYAKESGKQYIYLGSAQRPGDIYKSQFTGLEWFDGKTWKSDLSELKESLNLKSTI